MWVFFTILAVLIWTVVNITDKYVLSNWIKNPLVPVMVVGVIGLIGSVIIYTVFGFSYLSFSNILLALLAGIFYILMTAFYLKALRTEEVSRIVPLFYLTPLFILFFAALFLGEIFSPLKYLGIFLLVSGAVLISVKDFSKIRLTKAFWLMVLSALSLAVNQILTKYLLGFADYRTVFAYIRIGGALGIIPIVYNCFAELKSAAKRFGKRVVLVLAGAESLNLLAVLFVTIAVSIGYVTLVNTLSSVQPFFILLLTLILSIFYPSILKEEIKKSTISLKFLAVIFMFVGVILIT